MRSTTAQLLAYLQEHHGTEPLLIIEVQWNEDGPKILYSDQRISGTNYPYPKIIQVGDLDMATQIDGASDAQQINVTLDDVDGSLKTLIDTQDIHKRPVWVYQGYQGLSIDYKFLLFKGEISSPIIWDEGARTLSFDILTKQEDTEVAFSMEEGDFVSIPEEALGKVWPLVFGEVCNMQAVQVRAPMRGIITHGEGIHDFTLEPRICQAKYIQCPSVSTGQSTSITTDGQGNYSTSTSSTYGPDLECVQNRYETICNLEFLLEQQLSYENLYLDIRGGDEFPQGKVITLNIGGGLFRGYFSGTSFRVLERTHPERDDIDLVECAPVADRSIGLVSTQWTEAWKETDTGTAWYFDTDNYSDDCDANPLYRQAFEGGPSASQKAFDDMPTSSFFWIPPGTDVYLEDEAEILYIVSLLPSTINHVAAYKTQPTGRKLLLEVPSEYYTVYETDYDGYTVTEIGLSKKLSLYDSDWDDNLYISLTSDVGPNPVDIIEWLVEKYTDLTVDATSFTDVQARMTNYPTNFWVKERKNIIDLIQDIAYQTRCAIYIRNDVVYIKYLAEEPSSVRTITGSDILSQTFKVTYTPTEDLVTKHTIKWQNGEAGVESDDDVERTILLKYNIPKYGVQEEEFDYYTQNTYDTILKSATFWLIRRSQTWKVVEFDTTIKHLDLDLFDCISLDLPQFCDEAVKCIITQAQYNNETNTIHFQAWTPILAGTSTPYYWAWPADQSQYMVWPYPGDEQWADPGYSFSVTPPVDHILSGGDATEEENFVVMTSGDRYPSDTGDTAPDVFCEISDFEDVEEEEPGFQALKLARMNNRQQMEATMNKDTPAAGSDDDKQKERTACGSPQYGDGCIYEVKVLYVNPSSITKGDLPTGCGGAPCGCGPGGTPCDGTLTYFCHTFGAAFAATAFVAQKKAEIKALSEGCAYRCGEWAPYIVNAPHSIPDPDSPFSECEDFPGDPNAPNQSQIYETKQA